MWVVYAEWASLVAAGVLIYVWAVRPLLKKMLPLAALWAYEGTFWTAVRAKFAGIKGLIATRASIILTGFLAVHDFVASHWYDAGIDWTPLTDKVPSWTWPLLLMVDFWLILKFREWADRRTEAIATVALQTAPVAPEEVPATIAAIKTQVAIEGTK